MMIGDRLTLLHLSHTFGLMHRARGNLLLNVGHMGRTLARPAHVRLNRPYVVLEGEVNT